MAPALPQFASVATLRSFTHGYMNGTPEAPVVHFYLACNLQHRDITTLVIHPVETISVERQRACDEHTRPFSSQSFQVSQVSDLTYTELATINCTVRILRHHLCTSNARIQRWESYAGACVERRWSEHKITN